MKVVVRVQNHCTTTSGAEQLSYSGLEVVVNVGAVTPTTSSAERENSRIVAVFWEWREVGL